MNDYQPTGEQIEALANVQHDTFIGHGTSAPMLVGGTITRRIVESPAFQAIIRAAQAEALKRLIELRPNPMWHVGMYGAPQAMYGSRQIDQWMDAADPNPYREAPTA